MKNEATSASPCKVAIIGAGYMAAEHIKAFSEVPGAEIGGIFSRTQARAQKLADDFRIPVVADSVEDLWKKTEADLLVIAVDAVATAGVLREAARFPWKILAEKPVGLDLEEAECLERDLGEKAADIFVALNRRFYNTTRVVEQKLSQFPGKRVIEIFDQEEPEKLRSLGKPRIVTDNLMYANSIHVIDLFRVFGRGDIEDVKVFAPRTDSSFSFTGAAITFSSGDLGIYNCIWDAPGPWAVAITTGQLRCEMRPLEEARYQERNSRQSQFLQDETGDKLKPGLRAQAGEAVKAARGLPNLSVPLAEANKTMKLISKIYGR